MHTLAGWQALDLGDITDSWQYYEQSRAAAAQSDSIAYESHAAAEQAFVLVDARATRDAVDLLDNARHRANATAPRILRAWLAAAHGEALAAHGDRSASLHAFDQATQTFVRAETALRVDLVTALAASGEVDEARTHADQAVRLAGQVGSARQRRRVKTLLATVR